MHELSVCQSLLRQVKAIAAQHQANSVSSVTLQIGPLSGIEPTLLQQAFSLARAGTVAVHATLVIETLPIRVRCETCGEESEAMPNRLLCAHCGDYHTRLISGDEMLLASLELDADTEPALQQQQTQQPGIPGGKYV